MRPRIRFQIRWQKLPSLQSPTVLRCPPAQRERKQNIVYEPLCYADDTVQSHDFEPHQRFPQKCLMASDSEQWDTSEYVCRKRTALWLLVSCRTQAHLHLQDLCFHQGGTFSTQGCLRIVQRSKDLFLIYFHNNMTNALRGGEQHVQKWEGPRAERPQVVKCAKADVVSSIVLSLSSCCKWSRDKHLV